MTTIPQRQAGPTLRRYHAGYRIEAIASELRIPRHEVVNVLIESGVPTYKIAVRMRGKQAIAPMYHQDDA